MAGGEGCNSQCLCENFCYVQLWGGRGDIPNGPTLHWVLGRGFVLSVIFCGYPAYPPTA